MDLDRAAKCLAELGNPVRLKVYRLLVRAGPEGLSFGEIREHLQMPQSTLSHHIAHMVWAGLITQTREGRSQRCRAVYETMDGLIRFLSEECCADARRPATAARSSR